MSQVYMLFCIQPYYRFILVIIACILLGFDNRRLRTSIGREMKLS
jgi:hypothetical protein